MYQRTGRATGFIFRRSVTGTVVVLALTLLVAGCASDPSSPEQGASLGLYPFPWLKVSTPTYGEFHATAQTRGSSGTHYNSGGLLYTSTSHTQEADGGIMTASDMQIPIDGNRQYLSIGQPTFGAVTSWGLSGGSGIPAFTDSMYIPEEIVLTAPVASTISRTTGVTVGWNADAANDSVVVGFRYDVITIVADSTLPYTDYSWYRIVPDNGQYAIPGSAFSAIPVGGYVEEVRVTAVSTGQHYWYHGSSVRTLLKWSHYLLFLHRYNRLRLT